MLTNPNEPKCCYHCGGWHTGVCPRIKAVEYYPDGTMKRVEYHDDGNGAPVPIVTPPPVLPQVSWQYFGPNAGSTFSVVGTTTN